MHNHSRSGVAGGNVAEFQPGNSGNSVDESMSLETTDESVWATENGIFDIYINPKSNEKGRQSETEVESEPPNRRGESSILVDLAAPDAMNTVTKLFCKTSLCHQFQAGTCSIKNCDLAHGIEELVVRPSNWQEILTSLKEEYPESSEPREVFQIPVVESTNEVTQGRHVKRHCKKYFSEVGCKYGENCIYDHGECEDRKSEAICLLPGTDRGCESYQNKVPLNASNWKTRICNNWELSGFCAFGSNCHFAHGFAELQSYGGEIVNQEAKGSSVSYTNQVAAPAKPLVPYSYRVGASSRQLRNVIPKTGEVPIRKWNGPNKISKIYGDWIDDL